MRTSLALLAVLVFGVGCDGGATPPNAVAGNSNGQAQLDEYQAQVDAYNRQTVQADKVLEQQQLELERAKELMSRQEAYVDRYDKVLSKWEEQARRMDAVLDAIEKRVSVAPEAGGAAPASKLPE